MRLFSTPISSPLLIILTATYSICAATAAFNTRIGKAQRVGYLSRKKAYIPVWARLSPVLLWAVIFLLNWWYALTLFGIELALKELFILEKLGAWLLKPMPDNETASAVDTALRAADEIKAMEQEWKNQLKAMEQERIGKGYNNRQ